MSYSLCLEGNSTADSSEGIIMDWHRFQLRTSSFPEFLSFPNFCERIGPGFSYALQIFEIVRTAERGVKQGGMNIVLVPEQQPLWLGEEVIGVWAEELKDGKDAFVTGWGCTLSICGHKKKLSNKCLCPSTIRHLTLPSWREYLGLNTLVLIV